MSDGLHFVCVCGWVVGGVWLKVISDEAIAEDKCVRCHNLPRDKVKFRLSEGKMRLLWKFGRVFLTKDERCCSGENWEAS